MAKISNVKVLGSQLYTTYLLPFEAAAVVLVLAMVAAIGHFLCNTSLISLVPHLKRNEPLRWSSFIESFGWVGTTYAASALIAGLLYLVFKASGVGVMAGAVPIIIVLLVMLHYHFRQRESDERAQALRIEAAEHGIAVTVVYPSVVATETRRKGLNGRGEPAGASRLDESRAMPVDECARQIVGAIAGRRRELVMTAKGRFGLWLKLVVPGWVDNLARKAVNKEQSE